MRRLVLCVGGVVALASVSVGCGGGDGDTTEAPVSTEAVTSLSKEELIAQGDAICAEVNAAVGTVGSTSTGAEGQAGQVADLYSGMVERLKGLGAPSDESAGYEEFIGAADQLAQAQGDVALAAERGEDGALASAEAEASSALTAFRSAADAFGLEQCGEAPSAPTPTSPSGEAAGTGSEESSGGVEEEAPEEAPEVEEAAPETGGAGSVEEESAGGGAGAGGAEGGGGSSGGIGPG